MEQLEVTVLISVYNGELFLREAIDSLLAQTFENWECIIIDDGSTDGTGVILKEYEKRDGRFRIYKNEVNQKLPFSLNRGLKLARGRYIVRTDADDICREDRLEKQLAFMRQHEELDLSCCKLLIYKNGKSYPSSAKRRGDAESTRALFLFFDPICHGGVIAKREALQALLYDPEYSCTEDLNLWLRMTAAGMKLAVQDEYMGLYRFHEAQTTHLYAREQKEQYKKMIAWFYREQLEALSAEQLDFLTDSVYSREYVSIQTWRSFFKWVKQANKKRGFVPERKLNYAALEVMMAFKEQGMNLEWMMGLLECGPLLAVKEFLRRKNKKRKDELLFREANKHFHMYLSMDSMGTNKKGE